MTRASEAERRGIDGGHPHSTMSVVSVFDSECASVHINEKNEVAFRPFGLDIPDELAGACQALARLVHELPVDYDASLVDKAKVLDAFYVPTRYPNGHPDGAPFEHYGSLQSEDAIRYASEILEFVSSKMA